MDQRRPGSLGGRHAVVFDARPQKRVQRFQRRLDHPVCGAQLKRKLSHQSRLGGEPSVPGLLQPHQKDAALAQAGRSDWEYALPEPGSSNAFTLECSISGDVFFVGGSTSKDLSSSDAVLFAVSVESGDFEVLDDLVMREEGEQKMGVTSLRRDRDRDVLYAGVFQDIFIVEWSGSNFIVLRVIDNIHSCKVFSPQGS